VQARIGEVDSAVASLDRAMALPSHGDGKLTTTAACELTEIHQRLRNVDALISVGHALIAHHTRRNEKPELMKVFCQTGELYKDAGNLTQAEEMYRNALNLARELKQAQAIADQHHNLGLVYEKAGRLLEAESMFSTALVIDQALDNTRFAAEDRNALSRIRKRQAQAEPELIGTINEPWPAGDFHERWTRPADPEPR
jgi:tetratricopeptide (TPR) repeat protein